MPESFYKTLYYSNFRVFKCIKLVFSLEGMKSNYGSFAMSGLVGVFITFAIIHLIKGPTKIINIINNILENKINNGNIENIKSKSNAENNSGTNNNKIILNNNLIKEINEIKIEDLNAPVRKNTLNTKKTKFTKEEAYTEEDTNKAKTEEGINKRTNETSQKVDIKEKEDNKSENDEDEDESKIKEKYKNLLDEEINGLDYKIAIVIDKRTFWQYYFSLLKRGQLIIFTFITMDDYNLREIKILLFIASFSLYFTINAFFFTDETMDNIYEDNGIFNFVFQLPQIIYSSLITSILNIILCNFRKANIRYEKRKRFGEIETKSKKYKKNYKNKINYFSNFMFITYDAFLVFYFLFLCCI